MPLEKSLPLIIDLLHSLVSLEFLGVAHGDLVESALYVVDGGSHVMTFDLGTASSGGGSEMCGLRWSRVAGGIESGSGAGNGLACRSARQHNQASLVSVVSLRGEGSASPSKDFARVTR